MIENLPEVIIVGDIELFFAGLALAAGAPKIAQCILARRYDSDAFDCEDGGESDTDADADDGVDE